MFLFFSCLCALLLFLLSVLSGTTTSLSRNTRLWEALCCISCSPCAVAPCDGAALPHLLCCVVLCCAVLCLCCAEQREGNGGLRRPLSAFRRCACFCCCWQHSLCWPPRPRVRAALCMCVCVHVCDMHVRQRATRHSSTRVLCPPQAMRSSVPPSFPSKPA